jgi:hypothetical protein
MVAGSHPARQLCVLWFNDSRPRREMQGWASSVVAGLAASGVTRRPAFWPGTAGAGLHLGYGVHEQGRLWSAGSGGGRSTAVLLEAEQERALCCSAGSNPWMLCVPLPSIFDVPSPSLCRASQAASLDDPLPRWLSNPPLRALYTKFHLWAMLTHRPSLRR